MDQGQYQVRINAADHCIYIYRRLARLPRWDAIRGHTCGVSAVVVAEVEAAKRRAMEDELRDPKNFLE